MCLSTQFWTQALGDVTKGMIPHLRACLINVSFFPPFIHVGGGDLFKKQNQENDSVYFQTQAEDQKPEKCTIWELLNYLVGVVYLKLL